MGKVTVKIDDEYESLLRSAAFEKGRGKRGALSDIINEALGEWLKKHGSR